MIGEDEVAELKTITSKHSVKQAARLHTHSESSPRHITDLLNGVLDASLLMVSSSLDLNPFMVWAVPV